jgi:hypothetical protein
MEPVSISSLIISIAIAIAFLISKLHIKKCKSVCCTSDCTSPPNSEKDFKIDDINDIISKAGSHLSINIIDPDNKTSDIML